MIDQESRRTRIAVLGSTGSVGTQTLDVVRANPARFQIVALAAGSNSSLLQKQIREFSPAIASHQSDAIIESIPGTTFIDAENGLVECATHPDVDVVVVATSGIASLKAVIEAARAGKTIALANKEALVCAADILLPIIEVTGAELRPVDSEHSAIWQCLGSRTRSDIRKLILTASGGPFRTVPAERLSSMTVSDALSHPTWVMGSKITIDSATLVNKGLEVIEAHRLFNVDYDQIEVVVHPESIIHSLVEFADGSTLAQLSSPDMRLPIQYALSFPDRLSRDVQSLDLAAIGQLTFEKPDRARFPSLDLCINAGRLGTAHCIALCAADEVAVESFIDGRIRFVDIPSVISDVLDQTEAASVGSLDEVALRLAESTERANRAVPAYPLAH